MNTLFTAEQTEEKRSTGAKLLRLVQRLTLTGPDYPTRRLAARSTSFLLLGASAVFGAMVGL